MIGPVRSGFNLLLVRLYKMFSLLWHTISSFVLHVLKTFHECGLF